MTPLHLGAIVTQRIPTPPAPAAALLASGAVQAFAQKAYFAPNIAPSWDIGISVCAQGTWAYSYQDLQKLAIPGLYEAIVAMVQTHPIPMSAWDVHRLWARSKRHQHQQDMTEVDLTYLPSGVVLGLSDPKDTYDTLFLELQHALEISPQEDRVVPYAIVPNIASLLLTPQDDSGHGMLLMQRQAEHLFTEWRRTLPFDLGAPWLVDLPWAAPTPAALRTALARA